jgi:glycerophosphoryl diester phosphodiesterase
MADPLNIAHRGGAGLWPENTLLAFTEAARAGFDGAELDVQLLRDGKLAVFHDFRVKRGLWRQNARAGSRLLAHLDYPALAGLEIKPPRGGKLPVGAEGNGVPLLSDVIRAVRAIRADFLLLVEIKTARGRGLSAAPEAAAEAVVAELNASDAWDQAILVGFDWRALLRAKQLRPSARCWFSTTPAMRGSVEGSFADAIARAGGDGWFAHARQMNDAAMAQARARGLKVGVWTVNAKKRLRDQAARGPDAICTDRPDRLAAILDSQRPSNKAVER